MFEKFCRNLKNLGYFGENLKIFYERFNKIFVSFIKILRILENIKRDFAGNLEEI